MFLLVCMAGMMLSCAPVETPSENDGQVSQTPAEPEQPGTEQEPDQDSDPEPTPDLPAFESSYEAIRSMGWAGIWETLLTQSGGPAALMAVTGEHGRPDGDSL